MSTESRNEIIINRLFSGDYLTDNVGHEVINLYKDDSGQHYLYVQPYGSYSAEHFEKIQYMLLVRGIEGKGAVEVVGLAEGISDICNPLLSEENNREEQLSYIKTHNVRYGGKSIIDIFSGNKDHIVDKNGNVLKESPLHQPIYISMRAESVKRPSQQVYIVFKSGKKEEFDSAKAKVVVLSETQQARCSLKQYFSNDSADYQMLLDLIHSSDLWTGELDKVTVIKEEKNEINFFDVCGIEDYELAFSNGFAFFIQKYPELIVNFAKQYLNSSVNKFPTIKREYHNIDIWLENEDEIVVVENKVTSKINGVQTSEKALSGSQLNKYYTFAQSEAKLSGKKVKCFLLTPDYNQIQLSQYNLKDFPCDQIYTQILYSDVYDFMMQCPINDIYFKEFLKGVKRHTKMRHNDLFEVTRQKFYQMIHQNDNK